MKLRLNEQDVEIEVKNPGVLEVPEGKNVDDLPIKHFVELADRKGLGAVTKALNNLQVWNKKKNPSLSKWAGEMIDKVTKRIENQRKNESLNKLQESTLPDWQDIIIKEVYNVLENNRIYAEVYDDNDFSGNNSFLLCVEINDGDWKHEHRRADIIVSNLLDNYDNIDITNMGEETIGDSDSDTYSSIHKYMIIKNESNTEECYTTENTITEFSSNFDGTEFDEVEFYSDDLRNVSKQTISNTIEAQCSFPINVYDIEIDTMGNMIISYEVKEEDYNPDVIESTIIDILEGMEDRIRASRPVRAESISKKYVKAMRSRKSVKEDYLYSYSDEDLRYEWVKSKMVTDFDGWQTEYTMYHDLDTDTYVFILGDSDVYNPTNTEPDWECDTEAQADNWFANYEGYDKEDLDEGWNNPTDFGKITEDFKNEKLDDIDFIMYKYVQDSRFGIKIVADDQDGNYRVSYDGKVVNVSFDTDSNTANYVYTINDEGPYEHNSYEFISSDIVEFIDCMYNEEDLDESCNIAESSKCSAEIIGHRNYDGIHAFVVHSPIFDDYSYVNKLRKVMPEYRIDTTGFSDEVAIFADENELTDVQKYIKRFNTKYCEESLDESCNMNEALRYYVTDDDYIPLKSQPNNGYTELQAVERAQREAERSAKLFNLPITDTVK